MGHLPKFNKRLDGEIVKFENGPLGVFGDTGTDLGEIRGPQIAKICLKLVGIPWCELLMGGMRP